MRERKKEEGLVKERYHSPVKLMHEIRSKQGNAPKLITYVKDVKRMLSSVKNSLRW